MNCADCLELISGHIDGQNTLEEEAQMQAHLAGCAECREILAAYEQLNAGAASLEAEPPVGFVSGVMDRVSQEAGGVPAKKKRIPFGHGTAFAAVAAVLVILVGTGLVELPGRNMAKSESVNDSAESAAVTADSAMELNTTASVMSAPQKEAAAEAEMELEAAENDEQVLYDSAENYNAVFDALDDAVVADDAADPLMQTESPTDSVVMPESPSPNDPAATPDSMEAETERTEEKTSDFAVYAEVYDYSVSLAAGEPIGELSLLKQSEENGNVYYGTAAEILQIVELYQNTHSISCSVVSGYADTDAACIVIFE